MFKKSFALLTLLASFVALPASAKPRDAIYNNITYGCDLHVMADGKDNHLDVAILLQGSDDSPASHHTSDRGSPAVAIVTDKGSEWPSDADIGPVLVGTYTSKDVQNATFTSSTSDARILLTITHQFDGVAKMSVRNPDTGAWIEYTFTGHCTNQWQMGSSGSHN